MEIYGTLDAYFETGTEGTWWAIRRHSSGPEKGASHADFECLAEGDYLEIYSPYQLYTHLTRTVLWRGHIKKDTYSELAQSRANPERQQQSICGRWVHWLQEGFNDHEQWYWYFILAYPARLVRAEVR